MESVEFALRDFRHDEFEALWRIDQQCFEPGISYSRLELATYLRRSGAFTLVADLGKSAGLGLWADRKPRSTCVVPVGFIVAETGSRGTRTHHHHRRSCPVPDETGVGSQLLQAAEERLRAAALPVGDS